MRRRIVTMVAVTTAVAVSVSAGRAEWPRNVAKPAPVPGLPLYDYRPTNVRPAATMSAMSLDRVAVTPPGGSAPTMQMYQLRETRLQVDHCFVSRAAVALHPDGSYQISYRADQNPVVGNDPRSPLKPGERLETGLQTSQLQRNLFVVKVRAYGGAAGASPGRPNLALSAPVLVEFPAEVFWVQRGEPVSKSLTGNLAAVKAYYPLIDRVEVEFTYK